MTDEIMSVDEGSGALDSASSLVSPLVSSTTGVNAPTVLRVLLGTQLRRLRESCGISAQDAARAIRASESKISRIELGRNAVREVDIADLLSLYDVAGDEREQLLTLASHANQQGWWHQYQDVLPVWFQAYLGLEESADYIRSFDTQFVPGLLQTSEYAAAVLRLGPFTLEETERMVYLRTERQRRFAAGGLRLWAIIDEVALRRPVGGRAVMRRQLRHLLELSGQPRMTIQLSPCLTGASYAAPGSFKILTFVTDDLPDIVYVEQLSSAIYLDKRVDVERYSAAMDQISAAATTPEETTDFIHSLLAELGESE
jgi:transcriptional regulator with XRE-family HTH domain